MKSSRSSHRGTRFVASEVLKVVFGLVMLVAVVELGRAWSGLPGAVEAINSAIDGVQRGWLIHDVLVTAARWVMGFALGAPLGIAVGLLTGRLRWASMSLEGFMIIARAIPFIALVPVVVRVWGFSEVGKVVLIAWSACGMSWVVSHRAAMAIPLHVGWRAQSLGIHGLRYTFRVLLPSCGPDLASALRSALALSLLVAAVSELGGVYERSGGGQFWTEGLGYRLFRSLDEGRDERLYAAIIAFTLIGAVGDRLLAGAWAGLAFARARLTRRSVRKRMARASVGAAKECVPAALCVSDLAVGYERRAVFKGLNVHIAAGETVAWLARSGEGKSTGLLAIAGLLSRGMWRAGDVRVDGNEVATLGPWCGLMLQDAPVYSHLSVLDHVTLGSTLKKLIRKERDGVGRELLMQFGLGDVAMQFAGELSGGQRQRLALATALANRPGVLLADEPWSAVDAFTRTLLHRYFSARVSGRMTVLLVTHDLSEAARLANKVIVGVGAAASTVNFARPLADVAEPDREAEVQRRTAQLMQALRDFEKGHQPTTDQIIPL
jgi:ABC-type nitrate/sulfonate/bicarbonate transport system ATPase subunit/ABC-type nitrate/sulfonate/bicarbonate transport system permease component